MSDEWVPVDVEDEHSTDSAPQFEIAKSYRESGAHVVIGTDSAGPIGGETFVQISSADYSLTRHFYFEPVAMDRMTSFADRFIHDATFRSRSLAGTADWKQVAEIYDEAARRIEVVFEEHGLLHHRVGHPGETDHYETVRNCLRTICKDVYHEVDRQVRRDDLIDGLDTFIADCLDRAHEDATRIAAQRETCRQD